MPGAPENPARWRGFLHFGEIDPALHLSVGVISPIVVAALVTLVAGSVQIGFGDRWPARERSSKRKISDAKRCRASHRNQNDPETDDRDFQNEGR